MVCSVVPAGATKFGGLTVTLPIEMGVGGVDEQTHAWRRATLLIACP